MKIYISKKSELYLKWGYLIIGIPLVSLFAIATVYDYIYIHKPGALFGIIMFVVIAIFMAYYAVQPNVLLIDNDKILLKGIGREIKYDIEDFKEIIPYLNSYKIVFNDDKSYWFLPKTSWGYMRLVLSRQEKIDRATQQINVIKAHYKDKHSL
jgi:hypothetical protein